MFSFFSFADDAMDTASFHAHACADGVDTVIVGLYGYFGPFSGFADDLLDDDQTVEYLGDFDLQQFGEEQGAGTGQDDDGRIVLQPAPLF